MYDMHMQLAKESVENALFILIYLLVFYLFLYYFILSNLFLKMIFLFCSPARCVLLDMNVLIK